MALIELFEVAPGDDDAFLAEWQRERGGATLFRALRDDVGQRFVSVAPGSAYEVVLEDGRPDVAGGATQITGFDDDLRPAWERLREALAGQRGYLGTRLYRSASADVTYVAFVRWSSPLMVARALRTPAVEAVIPPFSSHPALYQEAR